MIAPQGRCWAVVPCSPAPPFRIYAGIDREPFEVTTTSIVNAARKGDPQFDAIVASCRARAAARAHKLRLDMLALEQAQRLIKRMQAPGP